MKYSRVQFKTAQINPINQIEYFVLLHSFQMLRIQAKVSGLDSFSSLCKHSDLPLQE